MRKLAGFMVLAVLVVQGCATPSGQATAPVAGSAAPPAVAPAPQVETLAADTPRATPAGATFTAPVGWKMTTHPNMVVLEPPESGSRMALIDAPGAADADAAIAAGWAAYRADSKRPLKLSVPSAPRSGWEERRSYQYETSPNEQLSVVAAAWRAGSAWIAIIMEAQDAVFEKRGAQFALIQSSLRPKGYQRESFAGVKAQPLDAQRIALLKDFVAGGMKELGVPGVGLAFIDAGKVVYAGGLGVKELGKPAPVDENTLFMAASNTKAMTTLLLAKLVDDKKLRWDQPVVEAYPAFKLGNADTTRQVQVKHLVCACTGMPRQDIEWILEYAKSTPGSSMALLGTMQPTSGFGELFQYSNLMASAAGYVGGSLASKKKELGAAYDDAMRRLVLEPLGMKHTTFDFAQAQNGNHARPHGDDVDGNTHVAPMDPNYSVLHVRPAGGVWTSARDLARYVEMELARGTLPNGKRYVSEENLLARRAPQVMIAEDITYGMGLTVDGHWGIPVVHHGGDMFGYHSDMIWLPEHGVGAVILTNSDPGFLLRGPLLRRLLEVLFDGKSEAKEQLAASVASRKANIAKTRERLVIPPDPAEAGKLAARYVDPALGRLTVAKTKDRLVFDVGEWKSAVASRKNDDGSTSFITIDPMLDGFEFVVADRDGKRALIVRDAQHEYAFIETK
jgi:CubicO group peptidase (beta-lactamase class C family)